MADEIIEQFKICAKCGANKSTVLFHRNRIMRDGFSRICKPCHKPFVGKRKKPTIERFWSYVDKTETCWIWTHARSPFGYGSFGFSGRPQPAHRISYELTYGPIPEGLWVLHKCDNPPCVNPDHLFLGKAKDNYDDMIRKRREGQGFRDRQRESKLTPDSVREARKLYATGRFTHPQLARQFGVADATMQQAICGRYWKHVL